MYKKLLLSLGAIALTVSAFAQTNLQTFYDFGKDRKSVTLTFEMFKNDNWGNTFFFIDENIGIDDSMTQNVSVNDNYFELARCFNFWQDSKLGAFSLQLEYNGGLHLGDATKDGIFGINHAVLAGVDYCLHSNDWKDVFNFKVLYKKIRGAEEGIPLQFTLVWGIDDLFGAKGLRFSGFADFWWQKHMLYPNPYFETQGGESSSIFISEPQLWYALGEHLNIGGEVELAADFGSTKGFVARPCLGIKWNF